MLLKHSGGGGASVNPLRAAFETLVAGRDRLAAAVDALAPLLDAAPIADSRSTAQLVEDAAPAKALPAGRKTKRQKVAKAKPAKSRRGISNETIAKIQALDAKGKPQTEIAEACGVSIPTVKKYSDAAPVARTNGDKPAPIPAAKTDPRTGRPWV